MPKFCSLAPKIDNVAKGAGLSVSRDINGEYRATSEKTGALIGHYLTEADAIAEMGKMTPQRVAELEGSLPFPTHTGVAGSFERLKPNDSLPMTPLRSAMALFETGPGAVITPIKQLSQAIEKLGEGNVYTHVYETTQKAKRAVSDVIGKVKQQALGGETFEEAYQDIMKRTVKLEPDQRAQITLHAEAFTKQELEQPGVLLKQGLDDAHKNAGRNLMALKAEHDIPILVRTNAMIDSFLKNREETLGKTLPAMQINVLEGKLPPGMEIQIQKLAAAAGAEDNFDSVVKAMGYTQDQYNALLAVRALSNQTDINLPAIYRWSTAPDLEAGFKNGRAQYAAKVGMTPDMVKLSEDRMKILETAFNQHSNDYSAAQVIGAQLPVFRQFIDAGILPGKQFGSQSTGPVRQYAMMLDQLEEGTAVLTRRVLSGHINPHELNPAISVSKHVRNLLMSEHLDPVMPKAAETIGTIRDERLRNIMYKYLNDLEGVPSEGFKMLNQMIRTPARFMGIHVGDDIAERFINTLDYLTYSASIPFRPAIIARNYFQTMLNIPIIGGDAWKAGLVSAMSDGEAAQARARAAGALKTDVVPLHGGQQALATNVLSDSKLASAGFQIKQLTDKGFAVYKKGDDVGRVISFEAGRYRVNDAWGKFIAERGTNPEAALENLKINAKVKTFDETIEAKFEKFALQNDQVGAANLIGKELADKVHLLYGDANHPTGWGGVTGRLFGQFGTFPVQYLQHVQEGLTRGTVKDRVEFLAGHSAVNAGIVYAGSKLLNANLTSWAFLPSLTYTGGPYAELGMNMVQAYSGSDSQKELARRNLKMMLPAWDHPSIFVPGSYFLGDLQKAYGESDPLSQVLRATGVNILKPGQQTLVDKGLGWVNEIGQ